jgi:hypothetical protein
MVSAIIMHISASAWTPGRADRVGVELHELAEPARPRLFVAEHPARPIGAVGQLDVVDVFGDMTGQRRGQVIAQAHPLLVIVLHENTPSLGRSVSGRNLPSASVYSNIGVSTGSKP